MVQSVMSQHIEHRRFYLRPLPRLGYIAESVVLHGGLGLIPAGVFALTHFVLASLLPAQATLAIQGVSGAIVLLLALLVARDTLRELQRVVYVDDLHVGYGGFPFRLLRPVRIRRDLIARIEVANGRITFLNAKGQSVGYFPSGGLRRKQLQLLVAACNATSKGVFTA